MSKVLRCSRPRTTSAHVATCHFCRRLLISILRLGFEAFHLSLLAFVSQVPVTIRLFLDIHRWSWGSSSLLRASTRRYYFTVLKVDRNTATNDWKTLSVTTFPLRNLHPDRLHRGALAPSDGLSGSPQADGVLACGQAGAGRAALQVYSEGESVCRVCGAV